MALSAPSAAIFVPVLSNVQAISTPDLRGASPTQRTPGGGCASQHGVTWVGVGVLGGLATASAARQRKLSGGLKSGGQRSTMHAFDPSVQEGVTEPFGYFDPLGFAKNADQAGFRKLRVAETKHGRVAMMASIGMVLPHFFRAPGFSDGPAGLGAVFTEMGGGGCAALFLGAGLHELVLWKDDPAKAAGDFGDPFKFGESIDVSRNYELNNGRMAMFAVLGQIVAELVTGKDAISQLGM
jgi:hypothetical protein